MTRALTILLIVVLAIQTAHSQQVTVDPSGVMRWSDTGEVLSGFGVNYTVPFAHAYRMAKNKGLDIKKTMDQDIHHFARLGFDLYRVHVWDTEISDTLGNLLENEHLDAFDYLLAELKKRHFKIVLTPIAFWGNGWPEPDYPTPGFSAKYGKDACLTDEAAILAQEKYLNAFVSHVNPYTGLAYKDDPDVVAFEVSNEPHHKGTPEEVTHFINRMAKAIRSSTCEKPIFYNMSHSIQLSDAYLEADVQGGTFQWYPTGLMYGKALKGNFLPNVDAYPIPFSDALREKGKARLVYEFDAANIAEAPMYPAMARSFRSAGIQIATHFSYDPTFLAYANTEYNTHYMNLAYTPQKALGLMLAGEVFHRVPLYDDYGKYPYNRNFEKFHLDEEKGLAEMLSAEKFIYTNSTATIPEQPESLQLIAGFGQSPIVSYAGRGAYFLDKIAPGKWRLELMPDAIITQNPYGRNSPDRTVAVIQWAEHLMTLKLPGLGENFNILPLNEGNEYRTKAAGGSFAARPGTFLLLAANETAGQLPEKIRNIGLRDFSAPPATLDRTFVLHEAPEDADTAADLKLQANISSPEKIEEVYIHQAPGYGWQPLPMQQTDDFTWEAIVPAKKLQPGIYNYQMVVKTSSGYQTFPRAVPGKPGDWDFAATSNWEVRILPPDAPICVFDANTDYEWTLRQWNRGLSKVPLARPSSAAFQLQLDKLFQPDQENLHAAPVYDYSFQHYIRGRLLARQKSLDAKRTIVLEGGSLPGKDQLIQLALTTTDGRTFGTLLTLRPGLAEYRIPLEELQPVPMVLLPRPYPTFLPYFFDGAGTGQTTLANVERIQISVGPGLSEEAAQQSQHFKIVSIRLE